MLFFGLGVPLLTNLEFQKFLSLVFKSSYLRSEELNWL